jgi:hypothetical protein
MGHIFTYHASHRHHSAPKMSYKMSEKNAAWFLASR